MFVNCISRKTLFFKSLCGLLLLMLVTCRGKESYPELEEQFAGPIAVAALNTTHFYVLNSDFDRTYDKGSLTVLDRDGNKLKTILRTRLGKGLRIIGNTLLVYYTTDQESPGKVEVYDLSNPEEPDLKKTLTLEDKCDPMNLVVRLVGATRWQALTCVNGDLYVGEVDGESTTLKKVREYGFPRRAIYIDPNYKLLYIFSTIDYNNYSFIDAKLDDKDNNEVPDRYESNTTSQEDLTDGFQYQYIVYDLEEEKSNDYPVKSYKEVLHEQRWLYFDLKDSSNKVDRVKASNQKLYRTNFWDVVPHPTDANSFLISQRDATDSGEDKSNNVIKVTAIADPHSTGTGDTLGFPRTDAIFSFERIYGYAEELPSKPHPGPLQVQMLSGKPILLVNHYREIANEGSNFRFSLTAKEIGSTSLTKYEISGKAPNLSYYELAMMSDGRTLVASFYGNLVQLFDVPSNSDITKISLKTIK